MRASAKSRRHRIIFAIDCQETFFSSLPEGGTDNKDPKTGLRRPFRNIGNFIVDLEWRAKNIDRKSIEAHDKDGDFLFSLIVNKELQQWMQDNNFVATIDDYQRKKSEYGSVLLKKTETTPGFHASGNIQRMVAVKTSYTPQNVGRRLRELENEGFIEVKYERNHAYYRFKVQMGPLKWYEDLPAHPQQA
jgi:DNA-binding transcriptional ArsR family regulator